MKLSKISATGASAGAPFHALALSLAGALCSGCASMTSTQEAAPDGVKAGTVSEGLPYYLPTRPILVSITRKDSAAPTVITVEGGVMEPDLEHRFTLKYGANLLGTNAAVLTVNSKGLLQSAHGTITSSIGEIATNVGSALGTFAGAGAGAGVAAPPEQPCVDGRIYTYVFRPKANTSDTLACNVTISIDLLERKSAKPNTDLLPGEKKSKAGVFFRQERPYTVTATDPQRKIIAQQVVYAPDESDAFYYPLTTTVFADSHTKFTFTDGVATAVDETSDSEINGLLQIPAKVLAGYATAVGNVFTAFSADKANDQATALANVKLQYCQAMVAANPMGGLTGADLDAAVTKIKAACQ